MLEDYIRDGYVRRLRKSYSRLDLALMVREKQEELAQERGRRQHAEVLNAQLKQSELKALKKLHQTFKDQSNHAVVREGGRNLVARRTEAHDTATRFSDSAVLEYEVVAEAANLNEALRLAASLDDRDYWEAIEEEGE